MGRCGTMRGASSPHNRATCERLAWPYWPAVYQLLTNRPIEAGVLDGDHSLNAVPCEPCLTQGVGCWVVKSKASERNKALVLTLKSATGRTMLLFCMLGMDTLEPQKGPL